MSYATATRFCLFQAKVSLIIFDSLSTFYLSDLHPTENSTSDIFLEACKFRLILASEKIKNICANCLTSLDLELLPLFYRLSSVRLCGYSLGAKLSNAVLAIMRIMLHIGKSRKIGVNIMQLALHTGFSRLNLATV